MSTPHFTPEGAEWVRQQHHDALLLAAADALAAWLHRDDCDKQGRPLVEHCRRVAATLREQGWPVEVQAAGLLHDAAESAAREKRSAAVLLGIDELFPNRTAYLVEALTRRTDDTYISYLDALVCMAIDDPAGVAIKLADLRDNLDESRGPIKESLRKRYVLAVERLTDAEGREP